jgi:hypothetical protein
MKLKTGFNFLVFLLFSAVVNAQDLPCGGDDPDLPACPIDTWVVLLVAVCSVFAVFALFKRKKSASVSTPR